jgi:hypothetical protein
MLSFSQILPQYTCCFVLPTTEVTISSLCEFLCSGQRHACVVTHVVWCCATQACVTAVAQVDASYSCDGSLWQGMHCNVHAFRLLCDSTLAPLLRERYKLLGM